MGCFDTIHFECPQCGEKIKVQSKSGNCTLKDYHHTSVPVDVAEDLRNTELKCPKCKETFYLGIPTPRVTIILTPAKQDKEIIFS